jgi:hypothetical protein
MYPRVNGVDPSKSARAVSCRVWLQRRSTNALGGVQTLAEGSAHALGSPDGVAWCDGELGGDSGSSVGVDLPEDTVEGDGAVAGASGEGDDAEGAGAEAHAKLPVTKGSTMTKAGTRTA